MLNMYAERLTNRGSWIDGQRRLRADAKISRDPVAAWLKKKIDCTAQTNRVQKRVPNGQLS